MKQKLYEKTIFFFICFSEVIRHLNTDWIHLDTSLAQTGPMDEGKMKKLVVLKSLQKRIQFQDEISNNDTLPGITTKTNINTCARSISVHKHHLHLQISKISTVNSEST